MKWPLVRRGIIKKIFIPYVIFVFSFLIYSTYVFENLQTNEVVVEEAFIEPASNSSNTTSDPASDPSSMFYHKSQLNYHSFKPHGGDGSTSNSSSSETFSFDALSDPEFWEKSQKQIFKLIILGLSAYFLLLEFR